MSGDQTGRTCPWSETGAIIVQSDFTVIVMHDRQIAIFCFVDTANRRARLRAPCVMWPWKVSCTQSADDEVPMLCRLLMIFWRIGSTQISLKKRVSCASIHALQVPFLILSFNYRQIAKLRS